MSPRTFVNAAAARRMLPSADAGPPGVRALARLGASNNSLREFEFVHSRADVSLALGLLSSLHLATTRGRAKRWPAQTSSLPLARRVVARILRRRRPRRRLR